MPTVPRYGEPKVELRPLQAGRVNPEVTPDMLGAGRAAQSVFAQAKGLVSDVAQIQEQGEQFQFGMEKQKIQEEMQIAEQQIKRANAEKEFEFQRLANTFETNILEEMIAKNKGKNSYTLLDVAPKAFDQYVNDTMAPLAFNDEQKQSMRIVSDTYRMRMNSKLHGYVASQIDAERELSYKANVASFVDAGIRNSNDKAAWAGSIGDLIGATRLYADEKGLPSEVYEQLLQSNLTSLHKGVIENYLSTGAYAAADKYLNENEKGMDPQVVSDLRPHIDKTLKVASDKNALFFEVDRIRGMKLGEEKALAEVGKLPAGLREDARRLLKEEYADGRRLEKENYDKTLRYSRDMAASGGLDLIPPNIKGQIESEDWDKLVKVATEHSYKDEDSVDAWLLSPEHLVAMDEKEITDWQGKLKKEEFDRLMSHRKTYLDKPDKEPQEVVLDEAIKSALVDKKIIGHGKKLKPAQAEMVNYLRGMIRSKISAMVGNKPFTFDDYKKEAKRIADQEFMQGKAEWKPQSEVIESHERAENNPATGQPFTHFHGIPNSYAAVIYQDIQNAGKPLDADKIKRMYDAIKAQDWKWYEKIRNE